MHNQCTCFSFCCFGGGNMHSWGGGGGGISLLPSLPPPPPPISLIFTYDHLQPFFLSCSLRAQSAFILNSCIECFIPCTSVELRIANNCQTYHKIEEEPLWSGCTDVTSLYGKMHYKMHTYSDHLPCRKSRSQ